MATLRVMDEMYTRATPPWAKVSGVLLCRRPRNPLGHPGTAAAAATLARGASKAFGGTREQVIASVAQEASGKTYVRVLRREAVREARHSRVGATIASLEARAANGGAVISGNARGSSRPRARATGAAAYDMDF